MPLSPHAASKGSQIVVIGAGVVGISTAYALARRGAEVLLLDRAGGPALGASFANGAQLSYAYTDAMAGPGLWKQLPGMLSGRDPTFRVRASLDPGFWRWGLSFLRNATAARLRRNTLATLELALESRAAMADLLERHAIDFDHRVAGKMHVYHHAQSLPAAAEMIELKRRFHVRQRLIGHGEAAAIEPALAGVRGVAGVVHSPDEEAGDPWRFSTGLLDVLRTAYGVQPHFGFDMAHMRRVGDGWRLRAADGREVVAGQVVVCAGIDSAALLRPLGIRLPLMAVKGYSFTAPCGPAAPATSITDTSRRLVFCRLGDRVRVAGLADLNHWDPAPAADRTAALVALARDSLPLAMDYDRIESHWAGLRPATPFSTPVIGRAGPGLVLNTGHGMLGWTLAMGSGERAAKLLLPQS